MIKNEVDQRFIWISKLHPLENVIYQINMILRRGFVLRARGSAWNDSRTIMQMPLSTWSHSQ